MPADQCLRLHDDERVTPIKQLGEQDQTHSSRDIDASGLVDIDASVVREVLEETELAAADLERRPGYVLTFAGAMVSIGVEYGSRLSARELKARILRHIAADTQSELVEVEIVQWSGDLDRIAMPIYAEVLLRMLFRRP